MVSALISCIEIPHWIPSVMIYNLQAQLITYLFELLLVMVLSHKKGSKQNSFLMLVALKREKIETHFNMYLHF